MNTLRVAIIGSGKVAHIHAKALQALPDAHFVAVCGRDMGRTQRFADQYGVQAYTRIEEMLASARIDVVIVCTSASAARRSPPSRPYAPAPTCSLKSRWPLLSPIATPCWRRRGRKIVSGHRLSTPLLSALSADPSGNRFGAIGSPILGTVQMYGWRDTAYYASDAWRGTWEGEGGGSW